MRERTLVLTWFAAICGPVLAVQIGAWAWSWRTDYGACLQSHQEPRHRDAWLEVQTYDCGKDCQVTIPVMHPAEDWIATVCDRYEYPDGAGPAAGRRRRAAAR